MPIASGRRDRFSIVTQEGSLMTIPFPRTWTRVFAVPRSMPMSSENRPSNHLKGFNANDESSFAIVNRILDFNYTMQQDPPGSLVQWRNGRPLS
jgi:hypothetical protein